MNENLRAKILRKIDNLGDEGGRKLLDYIEFLESKYNRSKRSTSPFEKVADTIEETFGTGKFTDAAAKGTADVVDAAGRLMSSLAQATKAAAEELQGAARRAKAAERVDEAEREAEAASPEESDEPERA